MTKKDTMFSFAAKHEIYFEEIFLPQPVNYKSTDRNQFKPVWLKNALEHFGY